ncbi:MAG: hypothetical protein HY820_00750 [Acidobacteria bacterium]|nr:hypothetical protein [Acidobacteriota bacterium]
MRTLSAVMICLAIAAGPAMAQTDAEKKAAADKAATDKAAADKAAADKAAADKAAADKAATEKAAADKAAADKKKKDEAKVGVDNEAIYRTSGTALTMLFVIAVLMESGFAVLFNWRVFLAYFSVTGVKTLVMIVASVAVVHAFGLDVLANLVASYKTPEGGPPVDPSTISGPVSKFITAMVLSGGSAGVNRAMNALGIRSDRRAEVLPTPPGKKAWIAIRVRGEATRANDIQVRVKEIPADQVQNAPDPIAGVILKNRARLSSLIMRDLNRFPQNGGYTLTPGAVYRITVTATDNTGAELQAMGEQYVFAEGAIVDFEVSQFDAQPARG